MGYQLPANYASKNERGQRGPHRSSQLGEVDCDRDIELAKSVRPLNVPAVAYYLDGKLVTVLTGFRQNVRGRLERLLRGKQIGYKDGMDTRLPLSSNILEQLFPGIFWVQLGQFTQ